VFLGLPIERISFDKYLCRIESYTVVRRCGIHRDGQMLPGYGFILNDNLSIFRCQPGPTLIGVSRAFCVSAPEKEPLPWSQPEFLSCITLSM
jgi:hypothetical protein